MRLTLLLGAILGLVGSADFAAAQSNAYVQKITAPEVMVRSGASEKFYPTSKLKQGDKVVVLRASSEFPGWLEIKPPSGSFSWIKARMVKREGKHLGIVVAAEDAPVPIRPGSAVTDKKPDVERWPLKRGTMVVVLDEPFQSDGESWLPIDVTPEEVRYIPAEAVKGSQQEPFSPDSPGGTGNAALVAQADSAFSAQSWGKAKQLYLLAANQTQKYSEKVYCYQKVNQIDQATGNPSAQALQPGNPAFLTTKGSTIPATFAKQTNSYLTNSQPANAAGIAGANGKGAEWSSWGKLRRTNFFHNGQRMYSLVDSQERILTYAVTTPNLTLEDYVGRIMCLYGTSGYHSDIYLRANYLSVSFVAFPENVKK